MSTHLKQLSPTEIRALISARRTPAADGGLRRHHGRTSYPLSFEQERLWFHQQLFPNSIAYNWPSAIEVPAAIDIATWQRAINRLVERHEILRTSYHNVGEQPVQRVSPALEVPVLLDDLTTVEDRLRDAAITRLVAHHARQPFDLERPPLFRCGVVRVSPHRSVSWFVFHHTITDGWSSGVIAAELGALMRSGPDTSAGDGSPLALQYGDFSLWQRERFSGDRADRLRAYWREQLSDLPVEQWPADYARPRNPTERADTVWFDITEGLRDRLERFARAERVSLFVLMLAAFGCLLHRYTRAEDIPIAVPVSERLDRRLEGLIGFFVNTLVMRLRVAGTMSFREAMRQVERVSHEAMAHQDMPFGEVVRELNPPRELGRNPLSQIGFHVEERPALTHGSDGHRVARTLDVAGTAAFYDVDVHVTAFGTGSRRVIRGMATYNTELFHPDTIRRFVGHYQALLDRAIQAPDLPVAEIPYIEASETQDLIATSDIQPVSGTSHVLRMFADESARSPEATALVDEGETLTYGMVRQLATRVADALRDNGVQRGDVVAICMSSSCRAVAAIIGVLAAGGAFVVIPPDLPPSRRQFILDDAKARAAVIEGDRDVHISVPVVSLTDVRHSPATKPRPWEMSHHDDLAYLIYTSGSTGRPKGVQVTHGTLAQYVHAIVERLELARGSRYALVTSLSADLGYTTVFPSLCSGGTLHVASRSVLQSAQAFEGWMEQHQIEYLKITPSFLRALTGGTAPAKALPTRALIMGGEPLAAAFIEELRRLGPACRMFNHYGPTECTIGVATFAIESQPPPTLSGTIPVGFPLGVSRLYVLDSHLRLVPVGVIGELFIGGPCTARGYVHAAQTAERFLPDPWSRTPGARMFRTGDMGRRLPSGATEFLHRNDRQIKVRGYRVELQEIEIAIARAPGVTEAAVVSAAGGRTEQRLVAFVVMDSSASTLAQVHEALVATLPAHMVPSAWVEVDQLPRTGSGKIDRARLMRSSPTTGAPVSAARPPRDGLERELCELWQDLLAVPSVGISDNFFHLGGHSLLVVRLLTELRKRYEAPITAAALFQQPTVQGLARVLRGDGTVIDARVVRLRPGGTRLPLFFVHPAGGDVYCYLQLARQISSEIPVYGLRDDFQGEDDSVEAMAERYIASITELDPTGPYQLAGWSIGALIAHEIAVRLVARGAVVTFLGVIDFSVEADISDRASTRIAIDAEWLATLANRLAHFTHKKRTFLPSQFSASESEEERIAAFARELQTLGLASGAVTTDFWSEFVRIYRRNVDATARFVPSVYRGDLSLFRSTEREQRDNMTQADLGWGPYCSGRIITSHAPGNHMTMMTAPHVGTLANAISAVLHDREQRP